MAKVVTMGCTPLPLPRENRRHPYQGHSARTRLHLALMFKVLDDLAACRNLRAPHPQRRAERRAREPRRGAAARRGARGARAGARAPRREGPRTEGRGRAATQHDTHQRFDTTKPPGPRASASRNRFAPPSIFRLRWIAWSRARGLKIEVSRRPLKS